MADQNQLDLLRQEIADLSARQHEIERRIARLEGVPFPLESAAVTAARTSASGDSVETRVGLTLVNRVGVVTLILGIAFFFKWAIDNNWIGPGTRVLLGIAAGLVALGCGEAFSRKAQQVFAQGITGAGIAVIYLAVYAAYGFYSLIPQSLAFILLAAVTAAAVALSVRYRAQAIAALGLFGGYLTPVLLSRGEDHPWFLLSYSALLDATALLLAKRERWFALQVLAVAASFAIFFAWWLQNGQSNPDTFVASVFVLVYFAMFLLLGTQIVPSLAVLFAVFEAFAVWHAHAWRCAAFEFAFGAAALRQFSRTHVATEYLAGQLAVLFGGVVLVLDWASHTAVLTRLSVETVSVSVLLAGYALLLVAIGVRRRAAIDRVTGLAVIALVILKLYVFDVWQLGRLYRIAAFVLLGFLLIGTSFVYSRFRDVIGQLLKSDAPR